MITAIIDKIWRKLCMFLRMLWLRIFSIGLHGRIPMNTVVYGKVHFGQRPCRITLRPKCQIGRNIFLSTSRVSSITIGRDVSINTGCFLIASDSITIGDNTAIGEYVSLRDQQHNFAPGQGVRGQGFTVAPISIGRNCWIGRGAFIGPGTTLGDNTVVAAHSVVHGDFPPGVMIAGAPAKVKRHFDHETEP